jgi:hypothetical protein
MTRITRKDLDAATAAYVRALASAGILRHPTQLQIGSKVNGVAYRMMFIVEGGGLSEAPGTSNGYLGMTAREAYDALHAITRTIEDVLYYQCQD